MTEDSKFDPAVFLASSGLGRKLVSLKAKEAFFSQGNPADCVFFLQTGQAKLTVLSERGKEATITLLAAGDFIGVDRQRSRLALGQRHRHHRLHRAYDPTRGDDPRHAC